MKIALDAMGGDYAPEATIHGAVWAARDFDIQVALIGQPQEIEAELKKHDTRGLSLSRFDLPPRHVRSAGPSIFVARVAGSRRQRRQHHTYNNDPSHRGLHNHLQKPAADCSTRKQFGVGGFRPS